MAKQEERQWSGKTDGQTWMLKSLIFMFKWMNIRILYGVMACVIPFYMLFSRKAYRAAYSYFLERHGCTPFSSFINVYLNQYTFGQVILDRFAFYAGKRFDIKIYGNEQFLNLVEQEKGFIMTSSHVGSYELAGYHLKATGKTINAIAFNGETETVKKNREKMLGKHNVNIIPVKEDMSHLFAINTALSEGNIVSIPGDRLFGSTKFTCCNFLGKEAKFPLGPFATAVQKEVPMLAIFVMKESTRSYSIIVKKIDLPEGKSKRESMAIMTHEFAELLEGIINRYPLQWFNFYDFWE